MLSRPPPPRLSAPSTEVDLSEYTTIEVSVEDQVLTVTLNRPHRLNAFDEAMCQEFERLWRPWRSTM